VIDRRRFLSLGSASVAAALSAACDSPGPEAAKGALRFAERRNERLERWLTRHGTRDAASPRARDAGGAFPEYHISKTMPVWDPAVRGAWRLQVTGAVRRPASLSLDDLQRLPRVTQRVNHYCVEGWTAVATWHGVRVRDLARLVEPAADAQYVDFESFDDGYHESWDLESATHPQTIVAYGMDGRLLAPGHGAPARLHSPIKIGYKNTKYLTRVVFLPHRTGGFWSDQGYEWYGGM
jgi:DMSO/TMAO reductase YedYZ molybdopterin-dependent catalytic subunit